jgi:hypothetical protein
VQTQITAGDSLDALHTLPTYPASAGWVLAYRLVPRAADGAVLTLATTPAGDQHRLQAPASTTAAWPAGPYTWVAWVTRGDESHTMGQGTVTVQPDPRHLVAGADGRSLARRTLDELLAAKAQWDLGEGNQRRYRIGDRELEFKNAADVERLVRFWAFQVQQEENARNDTGQPPGRIYLRALR